MQSVHSYARRLGCLLAFASVSCGSGEPVAKAPESPVKSLEALEPRGRPAGPTVEQEFGSIEPRDVEKTVAALAPKLEVCHAQGRERVAQLAGDVRVFSRLGRDGRVKYQHIEESTLGDRVTEECILAVFAAATWPKPIGGEAEMHNGFGWPGGSEKPPLSWGPEKVIVALEGNREKKRAVEKCRAGLSGDFRVTAYVEDVASDDDEDAKAKTASPAKPKKRPPARKTRGRFVTLGISSPTHDASEKAGCILDALQDLSLPSPGSYPAKVSFLL
jgi:hypothetical protein